MIFPSLFAVKKPESELIPSADLLIETVPVRPPGGQYVSPEPTWVKVTHLPTNTIVMVSNARSQHKNRLACQMMLEAYLTDKRFFP